MIQAVTVTGMVPAGQLVNAGFPADDCSVIKAACEETVAVITPEVVGTDCVSVFAEFR